MTDDIQRSARHRRYAPRLGRLHRAEIATITGHSLRDVRSILDAHYLHRDPALAESAIRKLEMGYAQRVAEAKTGTIWLQNELQNGLTESNSKRRKKRSGSNGWGTRIRT